MKIIIISRRLAAEAYQTGGRRQMWQHASTKLNIMGNHFPFLYPYSPALQSIGKYSPWAQQKRRVLRVCRTLKSRWVCKVEGAVGGGVGELLGVSVLGVGIYWGTMGSIVKQHKQRHNSAAFNFFLAYKIKLSNFGFRT